MPLRRFTYYLPRAATMLPGKPGVNLIVVMFATESEVSMHHFWQSGFLSSFILF